MNKSVNRYFLASIFLWPLLYFIVNMIFIYINKTPKEKKKFIKRQKEQHIKKHIFQKQQKQEHQQEKEQEHQQEKEQEQQNKKEGFTSYNDCMTQGYTKAFCIQNPLGMPGWCQCEDGTLGSIAPGFRGECVCGSRFW